MQNCDSGPVTDSALLLSGPLLCCATMLWLGQYPDAPSGQQAFYHPFVCKQTATEQNDGSNFLIPC